MLNSTIVANINNGGLPTSQKISSGLHSSLLMSDVDFAVTEIQTNASTSNEPQKFIQKIAGKGSANIVFNGHTKGIYLDNNRNQQTKPARTAAVNGNRNNSVESPDEEGPSPKVCLYVGKISSEWQQPHKIGAGLTNLGNTCFMNTVLQCLTYCPPLANYLLHDSNHSLKCKINGFCMMCEFHRHIKKVIDRPGDVVKPLHIYQKLKTIAKHFQFGRQEDAHEFLRYVIDNMWKSCLANYEGYTKLDAASKETTVINKIFGGYHRSQVTCLRCKEKNSTYDHFMDFILDVKQNVLTLEKALEKFTQPELLQNDNAYKCVHCKMKVSAQKKFSIFSPPNVATFQFKRFDYNRMCGGKITKHIAYPESLNLRPYMSNPKGGPIWYRLNAVLVHLGATCNSGHYYCFVRNFNGLWYIMDDTRVQQVSLNQVLNQVAYVLFYVRTNASENTSIKRPAETSTSVPKNNQFVKNGFIGSPSYSVTSNPISRQPVKNSALPAISKLSVSSSNANQSPTNTTQKRALQPLFQNREKISFGIGPAKTCKLPKTSSDALKKESPLSKGLMNGNMLVPYIEDSSESSEDESKSSLSKSSEKRAVLLPVNGPVINLEKSLNSNIVTAEVKNSPKSQSSDSFLKDALTFKKEKTPACKVNESEDSSLTSDVKDKHNQSVKESPLCTTENEVIEVESVPTSNLNSEIETSEQIPSASINTKQKDVENCVIETVDNICKSSQNVNPVINNSSNRSHSPSPCKKKEESCRNQIFLVQDKKPFRTHSFLGSPKTEKQNSHKRRFGDVIENSCEERASGHSYDYEKGHGSVSKKPKTVERRKPVNEALENNYATFSTKHSDSNRTDTKSWNSVKQNNRHFSDYSLTEEHLTSRKLAVYVDSDSEDKGSSSSKSSWEYEWVEKTKETIEIEKATYEDKFDKNSYSDNVSNHDVVTELQKHSHHMFGADVGTWDNVKRNKESNFSYSNRKYIYDEYDDELDKGKMRRKKHEFKTRHNDHNPFDAYLSMRNRYKAPFFNKNNSKFRYNYQNWRKPYSGQTHNGYGQFRKMNKYRYFHRR